MLALALRQQLEEMLRQELASLTQSQNQAQSGMTHAESRAENDKDTRAIESSYLARGLATRVGELRASLASVQAWVLAPPTSDQPQRASLGRVVSLENQDDGSRQRVFLAPAGAGVTLNVQGESFLVLSTKAPLGRAILGCEPDAEIEVQSPNGTRHWVITSIMS